MAVMAERSVNRKTFGAASIKGRNLRMAQHTPAISSSVGQ